eukprot:14124356-Alexandrium_andersonii.AAC.1
MHQVYVKQLRSVGAPTWVQPCLAHAALDSPAGAVAHVRAFVQIADMGPDQKAYASLLEEAILSDDL